MGVLSWVNEGGFTVIWTRHAACAAAMCLSFSSAVYAEEAAPAAPKGNVEEIVVTGSYIKGSAENAALPVDVVTQQEMKDQGNPNMIEMVRELGVTSGNLGQTNQFQGIGQGNIGVVSINLRGLGASRTLTLLNGRRQVPTETQGVDVSIIPTSALERTEVLLGGAAATYGSDAIAGVVNFITRSKFEGLEFGASEQSVQGSNGNQQYNAIYGWANDRINWTISGEYNHQAEITNTDRDWALRPFAANPAGGWSSTGMPGTIYAAIPTVDNLPPVTADGRITTSGVFPPFVSKADPMCNTLGGLQTGGAATTCRFQLSYFDNLQEKSDTSKIFSEFNYQVSDTSDLHVEALYAKMNMPNFKTSPSYGAQAQFGPERWIAPNHPGLVAFKAANPGFFTDVTLGNGTVVTAAEQAAYDNMRPNGVDGFFGHPQNGSRDTQTFRFGAGLKGSLFNSAIDYDIALTWSQRQYTIEGNDTYVERYAFALDGLGGPGCVPGGSDPATSTPGVGPCQYFNPFSNHIARSAVNGVVNPQFNGNVANSAELYHWLIGNQRYTQENDLLVWDAVLSGETPWTLPGGTIGWAAGLQARNEKFTLDLNTNTNLDKSPCPFTNPYSITLGNVKTLNCTSPTGPFGFLTGAYPSNTSRNVYAAFSELSLPITDKISGQFALRYEDYGSDVGSTVDPKLALRWEVLDWLTLRGSATTTFRGPPQSYLAGQVTSLVFIVPTTAFKAVNISGNPDLQSESATTWSTGFIVNAGNFTATVDYWKYDLKDPFQTEDANQIVSAYTAQNCYVGAPGAPTANCAALASHISPLAIPPSQIESVSVNIINGTNITTSGIDASAQYDFDDVMRGTLSFGLQGTYTIDYNSDDFKDINGVTLASGGDFAGLMNVGTPFTSLPDLKGNVWAKYVHGPHRFTYMVRYIGQYRDQCSNGTNCTSATAVGAPSLKDVSSIIYQDLYYNVTLFNDSTFLSVGVTNLMDKDPPQTATNLNYDPYTADPFGRMIKVGFTYSLGGK